MSDDIRIIWDSSLMEGDFSFGVDIQDLESDAGLETAVLVSLFTDRRAEEDDILPDPDNLDRRGWWGDLVSSEAEGDRIGSKLWLLNREKTTEDIPIRMKKYAEEALEWMLEDGVVELIEVETERQGPVGMDRLALLVKIFRPDGSVVPFKYEAQWTVQRRRF